MIPAAPCHPASRKRNPATHNRTDAIRRYLEFIAPKRISSGQETCQQGLQTSGPKRNTIVKECSDESGRPQLARANFSAAPQSGRSSATEAPPSPSTTAGPGLRSLPHRPSHRGRGTAVSSRRPIDSGHQIVGEVVGGTTAELPLGTRVGVSWIGGIDGTCWYLQSRTEENLCDSPSFTGYTIDGGYAEYAIARADFVFPLPRHWTICTSRHCFAPASLVSAAFA